MVTKAEKGFYPPELQWAKDTRTAASVIAPELVAISLGGLIGALDIRNKSRDRVAKIDRDNNIELVKVAAMADARRFIDSTGLAVLLGIRKSDSCFDFFESRVSEAIFTAVKKKEPLAGQVGAVLGRVKVDESIIDAVFRDQAAQNKTYIHENRRSICGRQAHDIQFLVRDLFGFLGRKSSNEQGVFPVIKEDVEEWITLWRKWLTPVSKPLGVRKTILSKKLPPKIVI